LASSCGGVTLARLRRVRVGCSRSIGEPSPPFRLTIVAQDHERCLGFHSGRLDQGSGRGSDQPLVRQNVQCGTMGSQQLGIGFGPKKARSGFAAPGRERRFALLSRAWKKQLGLPANSIQVNTSWQESCSTEALGPAPGDPAAGQSLSWLTARPFGVASAVRAGRSGSCERQGAGQRNPPPKCDQGPKAMAGHPGDGPLGSTALRRAFPAISRRSSRWPSGVGDRRAPGWIRLGEEEPWAEAGQVRQVAHVGE